MPIDETEIHQQRRVRTPRHYKVCEGLTEAGIYSMVLFGPWAFGSTDAWAIKVLTGMGYFLGALLVAKWIIILKTKDWTPSRWDDDPSWKGAGGFRILNRVLGVLAILLLVYCTVGALNGRGIFDRHTEAMKIHEDYIKWLPASFSPPQSRFFTFSYFGLALAFWSTRDWLLNRSARERRQTANPDLDENVEPPLERSSLQPAPAPVSRLPDRLCRLLWVLCLNGALLALVSILQRLSGTDKVLWLVEPWKNNTNESQFGPYAYRGNAAEYFNLLWPVCVAFWGTLLRIAKRRTGLRMRMGGGAHILLLPCAILMAAGPIISTSRGGAAICLIQLFLVGGILMLSNKSERVGSRLGIMLVLGLGLLLGGILGWQPLSKRLEKAFTDNLSGRGTLYENANTIARDYPVYGTGLCTFRAMYHFSRTDDTQTKNIFCHNDWLETRITLGWVGFAIVCLLFITIGLRFRYPGPIAVPWEFASLISVALLGCLLHAKFDFPLQIHSIFCLFMLNCCILMCLGKEPSAKIHQD